MSGAGVFDLDGALLGVVANCGNSDDYRVVSNESVPSLLGAFARAAKRLGATCGLRIEALTPDSKRALAIEQGMLVTEVADDGPADQAGLEPGDVITSIAGQPLLAEDQLVSAMESPDEASRTIGIIRRSRAAKIRLLTVAEARQVTAAEQSAGIRIVRPRRGTDVVIAPESAAYRAGVRTGDRILQIGQRSNPTSADLVRAITAANSEPVWIVYQRDRTRKLALVTK
jgi:S1-C subfamily serine protease